MRATTKLSLITARTTALGLRCQRARKKLQQMSPRKGGALPSSKDASHGGDSGSFLLEDYQLIRDGLLPTVSGFSRQKSIPSCVVKRFFSVRGEKSHEPQAQEGEEAHPPTTALLKPRGTSRLTQETWPHAIGTRVAPMAEPISYKGWEQGARKNLPLDV